MKKLIKKQTITVWCRYAKILFLAFLLLFIVSAILQYLGKMPSIFTIITGSVVGVIIVLAIIKSVIISLMGWVNKKK